MDDRRQHTRHKVKMAVSIRGTSVALVSAYLEDVSLGGARISTDRPTPVGGTVDILVMREDGPPLSMRARVQRSDPDSMGVQWFGLGEREALYLLTLMQQG
ncbi:MAG TPA: PilZ domain-containing protein [Kofleriaceae bacterium]|nr:PilZ domain-containing protein [Kofleriaceae bacterium]